MADDAPWTDPVVVPDDISALQADIEAYHREQRHERRHRVVRRLTHTQLWEQWAPLGGVIAGAVALAAIVFVVLTIGDTGAGRRAPQLPVAAAPLAAVGAQGGLLPDVSLQSQSGSVVPVRQLRPALFALVPMHCDCGRLIASLAGQAAEVDMSLYVVAPAAQDAEVAALPGSTHRGRVGALFDPNQLLAGIYDASNVTVLVVWPDATVRYLQRDVTNDVRLESQLLASVTTARAAGLH